MDNVTDSPAENATTVFKSTPESSTAEAITITRATDPIVVPTLISCDNAGTGDTLSSDSYWIVVGIIVVSSVLLLFCGYQFFKNRKALWMPNRGV